MQDGKEGGWEGGERERILDIGQGEAVSTPFSLGWVVPKSTKKMVVD